MGFKFNGDQRKVILYVELVADGSQMCVQPDLYQTVEEFKLSLAHLTGLPSDLQILVSKGRFFENGDMLMNYELEPDQTIFLVRRSGENTPPLRRTHGLDGSSASGTDPVKSLTIDDLLWYNMQVERGLFDDRTHTAEYWRDEIAKIESIPINSMRDFIAKILNPDRHSDDDIPSIFPDDNFPSDSEQGFALQQNQSDSTDSVTAGMSGCNNISQDQSSLCDNSLDGNASEEVILEHKFASQLAHMERMGLKDRKKNIRALLESSEDVEKAVQCLLDNPNLDD